MVRSRSKGDATGDEKPTARAHSPAKITAPRLRDVLRRERLLSRLDETTKQCACVWIEGPPGAGKTTLVLDWLRARRRPCLWYQVDAGDHDLATLCHYLGLAVEEATGRFAPALPAFTSEYLGGTEVFTRRYFEALSRRLPPDAVLVFDNVQEAGEGPLFGALRLGIEQLGVGQRVVCSSRGRPPAEFARPRANGELALLGWEDLRLTGDEAHGIARLRGATAAPAVEKMNERAQGWTAGLLLLLEEPGSLDDRMTFDRQHAQVLFDYFAAEIFGRLSEATRQVLMKTAFLPEISRDAARELGGLESACDILDDLVERNYFTLERPGTTSYEYHPLFRAFLCTCAEKRLAVEELRNTKQRAAELLAREGRLEDAAALYQAVGAIVELSALIRAQADELARQSRYATLRHWLEALPKAAVAADAWLSYWLGVARMYVDPKAGEIDFATAYALFQREKDARGVFLSWCGAVETLIWPQTECARLAHWTARLDEDIEVYGAALKDPELEGRVASSMLMALYFNSFDQPRIAQWATRAARVWGRMSDLVARLQVGASLSHYYFQASQGEEAAAIAEAQSRVVKLRREAEPGVVLQCMVAELLASHSQGRAQRSIEIVDEALALADATGIHIWDFMLTGVGLMAVLAAGDLERGDRLLEICGRIAGSTPESLNGGLWNIGASWRARFDGRYAAGLEHAEEALRIAVRGEARMPQTWCQYALAHACLDYGDAERAAREADAALSIAKDTGIRSVEIWVKLLQARIALLQGDDATGLACLEEGLRHQDPSAYCLLVGWLPEHASSLYATALEHGIHTDFVRKIIRHGSIPPPPNSLPPDAWPLPLKIYTLGRFSVHIDERPLTFRGKSQKKPLELLKALIAFGGRSVREERLVEALWPEADGDAGARALTSALHRLRKLIGTGALTRKEGHLTLEPRHCWVDLWPLERRLSELEGEVSEARPTELARRMNEVLSLYRGAFLDDDLERSWMLPTRERLRGRMTGLLEKFGERLLSTKEYARALDCFERALQVDPTRESSYRGLIRVRTGQGERAEILAAYERCRKMLASEFGCAPSAETEALLARIGLGAASEKSRRPPLTP